MATAKVWKNVAVAMQSALEAADTVSAITKANPAVLTATAHGWSNGDYVYLEIQGMYQLNGVVARVDNVTANTAELEGWDTTTFDTFTSGIAKKVTFGTSITTATTINASGGDFDFIDTTTIHNNTKTQIPGLANPSTFTMDNIWDVSDAALLEMKSAADSQAIRAFKFTFGTGGQIMVFAGYVGATLLPAGQAQGLVTTQSVVTMFGRPSYYAS